MPIHGPGEDALFTNFHHVSYLVPDLDAAIESYVGLLGAKETGRGRVANLGLVGFLQAGEVEVEFIQPDDPALLPADGSYAIHHVAYAVDGLDRVVAELKTGGYRFLTPEPFTNFMGYRLIYFDPAHTGGSRVHLTDAASLKRTGV